MRLTIALTLALLGTVVHAERRAPPQRTYYFSDTWTGPLTLAGRSSGSPPSGNGGVMTIIGGEKWGDKGPPGSIVKIIGGSKTPDADVETGRIVNSDAVFTGGQTSFAGGEARFSGGTAQGVARGGDMTFEAGHGFPNGNVVFDNGGPRALIDPQGRFVYRGSEVATVKDVRDATIMFFFLGPICGWFTYGLIVVIIAFIRRRRLAAYLARQPEGLDEGPYRHE